MLNPFEKFKVAILHLNRAGNHCTVYCLSAETNSENDCPNFYDEWTVFQTASFTKAKAIKADACEEELIFFYYWGFSDSYKQTFSQQGLLESGKWVHRNHFENYFLPLLLIQTTLANQILLKKCFQKFLKISEVSKLVSKNFLKSRVQKIVQRLKNLRSSFLDLKEVFSEVSQIFRSFKMSEKKTSEKKLEVFLRKFFKKFGPLGMDRVPVCRPVKY